jgi:thioesterase domain-containing protein
VAKDDNSAERGGHSLHAVSVIAEHETRFGVLLSPALLFKTPTVSAIAKAIDDRDTLTHPTRVVPVQTEGSNPPIFALPGGGGSVIAYAQLARALGRNQPFYGLEHPGLKGGDTQPDRIEALAGSFLDELRNLHPGQPCVLIGACSGAIVAFELARLLVADGRHVARVIMLDPSTTGTHRTGVATVPGWRRLVVARFVAKRLASYARGARQLKGSARRQFLREKGRQFGKVFRRRRLLDENARELNRLRTRDATIRALRLYSPRPYNGAVTLIAGARFDSPEHAKSIKPWREVCTGSLEIHHIPVETSGEMLRPPAVSELVRQLTHTL